MEVERSATRKLRDSLRLWNVRNVDDLLDVTSGDLAAVFRAKRGNRTEYTPHAGWFTLESAKSLNGGTESLAEMAVVYCMLRLQTGNRFRVPLLYRQQKDQPYSPLGFVEAIIRFRRKVLVSSPRLASRLGVRTGRPAPVRCVVIVESEFGEDQHGHFDLPVPLLILASRENADGGEPRTGGTQHAE
jgi:hypothetical protein